MDDGFREMVLGTNNDNYKRFTSKSKMKIMILKEGFFSTNVPFQLFVQKE